MKKNIVISFGVNSKKFSIWSNGSVQNVFYLFMLLIQIPEYNVHIVNFGKPISEITCDDIFDLNNINFTEWDDIKNDVDVFIEMGIIIDDLIIDELRKKGTKLILFRTGNAYVSDCEDILFNTNDKSLTIRKYDQIWVLPHHVKINKSYLEELYKTPVSIVPFIWNPFFIDMYTPQLLENDLKFECVYEDKPKNIVILEPNLGVVKSFLIPLLIAEKTNNNYPQLINKVIIFNTNKIKNNKKFLSIIQSLKIYDKIQLEDRYNIPFILSKYTDVVVSHQWENELNYLYLDVMYGKYPLVHNSNIIKNTGYFYGEFNIESGSNLLLEALTSKNNSRVLYNNITLLEKLSINNQINITEYQNKIELLYK